MPSAKSPTFVSRDPLCLVETWHATGRTERAGAGGWDGRGGGVGWEEGTPPDPTHFPDALLLDQNILGGSPFNRGKMCFLVENDQKRREAARNSSKWLKPAWNGGKTIKRFLVLVGLNLSLDILTAQKNAHHLSNLFSRMQNGRAQHSQ